MKDYIVIRNGSLPDLISKVNMWLDRGYVLAGGISVVGTKESIAGYWYIQAIYKPKT